MTLSIAFKRGTKASKPRANDDYLEGGGRQSEELWPVKLVWSSRID